MTLSFEVCKKQCITWHVTIPGANKPVESPSFPFQSSKWAFKFMIFSYKYTYEPNLEEKFISMKIVKRCTNSMPERFLLTVHIRSKFGNQTFVTCKEIDRPEVNVFSIHVNSVQLDYYKIDLSLNELTFIFSFDPGTYKQEQLQTSSYLDDLQCLDNLSLDLRKLLDEEGSDPDVRLKCGNCTFRAHRRILGARSEVFRSMLQGDMKEGRGYSVEIIDMDPEVFKIFLRYLYTGLLPNLNVDVALSLFKAGDKYKVEALRDRCKNYLESHLTREKACEILAAADAHSEKDLKDQAISYILDKNIPNDKDLWPKFCDYNLKLATEVLSRAYKQSVCSAQ